MRPLVLLLLLAGSARAAPADSLTGVDMRLVHRERRAALAEKLGEGTLVLFSAPSHSYRDSRPDPDLLYLTGITAPRAALVLRVERPHASEGSRRARALERRLRQLERDLRAAAVDAIAADAPQLALEATRAATTAKSAAVRAAALGAEDQGAPELTETLYLPPVRRRAAVWNAPTLGAGPEAALAVGIERVVDIRTLFADLERVCEDGGVLFLLRTRPAPSFEAQLESFRERRADLVVHPAEFALRRLRSVKHPEEIARIERACLLTTNGLHAAIRNCRPGMAEYELQAHLEFECRKGGAPRQAFSSIVGSGPNSLILHYRQNRRTFAEGEVVLMDVGGEYMDYAADVTRTFPVSGGFTDEQAEVYDVVLRAQLRAIAAVRPGAGLGDVDLAARGVISRAGYARGIRHRVSHHVGLDVHDPAPQGPLKAGMVITVEPGIYLADRGFGIRIEDTVLVTEDGARILSPGVPKCRSEIEMLMAADREERQAVREVLDRLGASDGKVQTAARRDIEDLGSGALPTILSILSDPNSPLRENAGIAATVLGDAGITALLAELGAKSVLRRRGAAFGLGLTRSPAGVEPLVEALDDPEIRDVAIEALGEIGPEAAPALPALERVRKNYEDDDPVREAIEKIRGE